MILLFKGSNLRLIFPCSNSKITSLAARLIEPNRPSNRSKYDEEDDADDDEALFAELEAEIDNDGNSTMREQGLAMLRRE